MKNFAEQFHHVQQRIRHAETEFNRIANSVQLLAVSKQHSITTIETAFSLGQRDFGESYLQEAIKKITATQHLPICWHFIGPLQSNKTRILAEKFDWVHSIDRFKTAKRLNDQRPKNFKPLNICLQIKLDSESNKSGILPVDAVELAKAVTKLPQLKLRGLMTIPIKQAIPEKQRANFARLHELLLTLQRQIPDKTNAPLDTLSMGMSNDLEAAIAEGATIIRVGTALFGQR